MPTFALIYTPCDKYDKVKFFNVTAAFVNLWNSHKIKSQTNLQLPNGVPTHVLYFPQQCGGTQNGIQVTNRLLQEAFTQWDSALTMEVLHLTSWMKRF